MGQARRQYPGSQARAKSAREEALTNMASLLPRDAGILACPSSSSRALSLAPFPPVCVCSHRCGDGSMGKTPVHGNLVFSSTATAELPNANLS